MSRQMAGRVRISYSGAMKVKLRADGGSCFFGIPCLRKAAKNKDMKIHMWQVFSASITGQAAAVRAGGGDSKFSVGNAGPSICIDASWLNVLSGKPLTFTYL